MLWKIKIPNKVKLFAWIVYKEGLPTQYNLIRKYVYVEDECCFCQNTMEDLSHALFYYSTIQDHRNKYIPLMQTIDKEMNMMDIPLSVKKKDNTEDLALFFS